MLARFESEEIHTTKIEVDLNPIIQYCIHRLNEQTSDKGIIINFDDSSKADVFADPSLLEIIFENLLTNAVKYSNGGSQIDVFLDQSGEEVKCSIRDYGIGMKPEQIMRVFDRFYRSEEARSTEAGGHGIGMAIVKRLSDLQNIEVVYKSEISKGTTATLIFKQK